MGMVGITIITTIMMENQTEVSMPLISKDERAIRRHLVFSE